MGKSRLIAETGAGQHGVATALAGALFGLETRIYMGALDVERQKAQRLPDGADGRRGGSGRERRAHPEGRDQRGAARLGGELRDDPLSARHGRRAASLSADGARISAGDRPEARAQILEAEGRLPDACIAAVGGGSNAIGLFADFVGDEAVRLIGVEAAGRGLDGGEHGATLLRGRPGILHGAETYVLQDEDGQIDESWSVSAGLDYPAVGPEHAFLKDSGRADYVGVTDAEALAAFALLARTEGIICAFESAHALAHALKLAAAATGDTLLVVNLSGRGDKDMEQARRLLASE
jgi:tryptophan synthase beta chain